VQTVNAVEITGMIGSDSLPVDDSTIQASGGMISATGSTARLAISGGVSPTGARFPFDHQARRSHVRARILTGFERRWMAASGRYFCPIGRVLVVAGSTIEYSQVPGCCP
jgi:hypothetical protein